MILRTAVLFLVASQVAFAEGLPKNLSVSEKKAIAKYDDLPEEFREKAKEAWYAEYKRTKKHSKVLKNDPPYYPALIDDEPIKKGRWGHIVAANPAYNKYGITVFQIIDKSTVICKSGNVRFFVEGIDTSGISDGDFIRVPGVFVAAETKTYKAVAGGSNTIWVLKRIRPESDK